jgi:hypothetical protein
VNIAARLRDRINVFSMSETYQERLMWGYYTNSYQGYCMEFNFSREREGIKNFIFPMKYNITEPHNVSIGPDLSIDNFFTRKHVCWKHESECRLIFVNPEMQPDWVELDRSTLRSIIFGYRAHPDMIQKIKKLCNPNGFGHVNTFRWNYNGYEMVKEYV